MELPPPVVGFGLVASTVSSKIDPSFILGGKENIESKIYQQIKTKTSVSPRIDLDHRKPDPSVTQSGKP